MTTLWAIVRKKSNREIISWLSGGAVVVVAGLWAAFVYFFPPKKDDGGSSIKVEANCGSAAVQGYLFGSSITTGGASSTINCPPKSK
jgi:hypothetical protein